MPKMPAISFSGRVLTEPDDVSPYLLDESSFAGHALGVVLLEDPADTETVSKLLRACTSTGTPLTMSARRTSYTGASIPQGGWVLALPATTGLEQVHVRREPDGSGRARSPSSAFMVDLALAAESARAFFPPDPTSRKTCSVGGAVACNASGARSFKYGPMGAFVEALTVVLPTGEVLQLVRGEHPPVDGAFELDLDRGRVRVPCPAPRPEGVKSALGYATFEPPDALDLFIGSEGTLGYISEVEVRLLPACQVFAALAVFRDEALVYRLVSRLQQGLPGLSPMSVEFFDRRSLELAGRQFPRLAVPEDAAAALFLEEDHDAADLERLMSLYYEVLVEAGVPDLGAYLRVPSNRTEHEALRDFRHAVPEAINATARQRGLRKLGTDLAWPRPRLSEMTETYRDVLDDVPRALGAKVAEAFLREWGRPLPLTLDFAAFGHIGDSHLHVNLLPSDACEMAAGKLLYDHLARRCVAAGGVISGEHGIGKSKRDLLTELSDPETLETRRAIKAVLDPAGILARGNVI